MKYVFQKSYKSVTDAKKWKKMKVAYIRFKPFWQVKMRIYADNMAFYQK